MRMQFKPEVTAGTLLTMVSMLVVVGIAWGDSRGEIALVKEQVRMIASTEQRLENRVDVKLNTIDNRLERIEGYLIEGRR